VEWRILQIADSAFPVGGFVHSGGLEAAHHLRLIADLPTWLEDGVQHAGHSMLPLATAAWRHDGDVDAVAEARIIDPVGRRASLQQGLAWSASAAAIFPSPEMTQLKQRSRQPGCGHAAPVFGRVCVQLEVSLPQMQRLFLFMHLRGQISTAVRLGLCGPMEGQRMQARLASQLDQVAEACAELTLDDLTATAPLAEIAQSQHDRLYSRLFTT
jgi:urease accessory protein